MPYPKKYEVTHAPCAVCGLSIELKSAQKKRVSEGKSVAHGGQCKAIHQKRWNAARHRRAIEALPATKQPDAVVCFHCKRSFVPLPDVVKKHKSGEYQHYFCSACVGKSSQYPTQRFPLHTQLSPEEEAEEARRQVIREAYFSGIMPDVRHYRRAW